MRAQLKDLVGLKILQRKRVVEIGPFGPIADVRQKFLGEEGKQFQGKSAAIGRRFEVVLKRKFAQVSEKDTR